MFLLDDVVVFSASDLAVAAHCEYAALHALDVALGRVPRDDGPVDQMLERTARLGDAHEARWLERYRERFGQFDPGAGRGVAVVERPPVARYRNADVLRAKHAETLDALRSGADVVFQGGFFDGRFHGWSDFLVRQADGSYAVYDAKLARHAKVTAVLQLAAYADQLIRAGIRVDPAAHLILGDHTTTSHVVGDVVPLYRHRRARLAEILDVHLTSPEPARWDDGVHTACGRCEHCQDQVAARRDVLVVAGMRTEQRAKLRAAGVDTIDDLATHEGPIPGMAARTLAALRAQARLQVAQDPPDGEPGQVTFEVVDPEPVRALPAADPGDMFFDFEGDPLWSDGDPDQWGLEYLFGWVDAPEPGDAEPPFSALWAHDRAEERAALEAFVDHVTERRRTHPGMHVYHYAPYETTALTRLVGRHGTREEELDALLRAEVFVDLYSTVRHSIRVSQPSYSIKKLEPLYMEARSGLDNAADSITDYALACEERDGGHDAEWHALLDRIAAYNADDCRSTYLLREWLVANVRPGTETATKEEEPEPRRLGERTLQRMALADALVAKAEKLGAADGAHDDRADGTGAPNGADARACRLLAASLEFWRREEKPAWWAHFARLKQPPDEWADTRNVVLAGKVEELAAWERQGRGNPKRRLLLSGELEAGTDIDVGSQLWPLYGTPTDAMGRGTGAGRGWNGSGATVESIGLDGPAAALEVRETLPRGAQSWDQMPMALVPAVLHLPETPADAVARLAEQVIAGDQLPRSAVLDLLRRQPPMGLTPGEGEPVARIVDALTATHHCYVAVQGPPGTGKTFAGSRAIARLVADGWRVGVVAQSHAVVEHLLGAVLEAGVPGDRVAKKGRGDGALVPWTVLDGAGDWADILAQRGCVVGGTIWDFANPDRVPPESLDLLVVDEAGQFSLAATVAVAGAASRLLLLGDPRQLPQVSQGNHPEPVDVSALGWLLGGAATIPPDLGILLTRTWRLHPQLCAAVSDLSYDGRLESMPEAEARAVVGIEPGLHTLLVEHHGNRTVSPEECDAVVGLVTTLVGRTLVDGVQRPMTASDVIVVAAYNAQVAALRAALGAAGFGATPVGTVDKFQGREAAVAIVSLAASSATDVPRGIDFLLDRNRLNVAISRGKVASFLVHAPRLRDHLPATVEGLEAQGAFVGLSARGDRRPLGSPAPDAARSHSG